MLRCVASIGMRTLFNMSNMLYLFESYDIANRYLFNTCFHNTKKEDLPY